MHRYELKCNFCGVTIGYVALCEGPTNLKIVKNIRDNAGTHPICCAKCKGRVYEEAVKV